MKIYPEEKKKEEAVSENYQKRKKAESGQKSSVVQVLFFPDSARIAV